MNKTTSRFVLMFGIVAIIVTGFTVSESFGDKDLQKLEEKRQQAIDEQIKLAGIDDKINDEEILEERHVMTLKESMTDKSINSVNAVKIKATFNFADKSKEITSFNIFKQVSGFDREKESTVFVLQGVVGIDKSLLYRAADSEYNWGAGGGTGLEHKYSEFAVGVTLEQGEFPVRTFDYRRCTITDYSIDTLHDNDESYSRASTFVIVDNFEFTCFGYQPWHYDYEGYIEEHGIDAVMEMEQMEMDAMTPQDYNKQ